MAVFCTKDCSYLTVCKGEINHLPVLSGLCEVDVRRSVYALADVSCVLFKRQSCLMLRNPRKLAKKNKQTATKILTTVTPTLFCKMWRKRRSGNNLTAARPPRGMETEVGDQIPVHSSLLFSRRSC